MGTCFGDSSGGDNIAIGREAGKWVAENWPDGCKLVELSGLGTVIAAQERHDGFLQGINGVSSGTQPLVQEGEANIESGGADEIEVILDDVTAGLDESNDPGEESVDELMPPASPPPP